MTSFKDSGRARKLSAAEEHADSVLNPVVDVNVPSSPAEPGTKTPDLTQTAAALAKPRTTSIEATLLSGLAVLGANINGGVAFWAHVGGFVAGMLVIPIFKKRSVRLFQ